MKKKQKKNPEILHIKFFIDGEEVSVTKYHQAIYDGQYHEFTITSSNKPTTIILAGVVDYLRNPNTH